MSPKKQFSQEEAKILAEQLGVDWTHFDVEQFTMGINVELEHGLRDPLTNVTNDDPLTTAKIALAHLNEFPDYYTRLDILEKEADDYWKDKKK
ncbi:MAG: hypothetical protein GX415_05970 [Chloroflexi bacterium]|nr:hypothetical protein [Chloroflexota bacterium]HOE35255.1 hypothetical protein [Anaerolineaceae bacterium]HOT26091.1 hypothetical protein [Anaerolineaceae bacterium]HQK03982.1 hypothetical protein [Anaerolineaceae bacterium]HQL27825.1 hypothetical protein [Anaerolineaceae bacterium]